MVVETRGRRRRNKPVGLCMTTTAAAAELDCSPAPKRTKTTANVTPSPKKSAATATNSPPKKAKTNEESRKTTTITSSSPSPAAVLKSSQVACVAPNAQYIDLQVSPAELRPSATLTTGQCFHWRVVEPEDHQDTLSSLTTTSAWGTHNSTEWVGTLRVLSRQENDDDDDDGTSLVISLKQSPDTTLYRILYAPPHTDVHTVLHHYFQLHQPLESLYHEWSQACPRCARIAQCIPGVRILEQDPWECLVSFLCSSNNNIPRITQMLQNIRQHYGTPLVALGGNNETTMYSFPSFKTLHAQATEEDLRNLGMGYRAKYLMETMQTLHSLGGEQYLHGLRLMEDWSLVQQALMQFCGVGRKVADCVALFSLRQGGAIPVDVHVWDIARRDYDANGTLVGKSLTPSVYKQVGDLFRAQFPHYAGWAHSLLFVAELPSFRAVLPPDVLDEMDKVREHL